VIDIRPRSTEPPVYVIKASSERQEASLLLPLRFEKAAGQRDHLRRDR